MACTVCGAQVQASEVNCRACGSPLNASVTLPVGTTLNLGQYIVHGVLGQGGFGITYEARDQRLGHRVAIKELFVSGSSRRGASVLSPNTLGSGEFAETKRRFIEEGKALGRFSNPGIVRVLNFFEDHNTAYLVMEFLEGQTLGKKIETQRGALDARMVEKIALATAETLAAVHQMGLLHRDIKPDNIFLEQQGRVVLIDFGSVRAFAPGKTVSHTRLVTPGYAPLEQYGTAAKFGPYTDIYALGATLHHALTGKMPPATTDLMLGTPLPPLPQKTPQALQHAIEQAMAVKVADRPQTAEALLALLKATKVDSPDILSSYLRQQNLTEVQFRNRLYEGTVDPADLSSELRDSLIQKGWLDWRGEVPDYLRRSTPKPVPTRTRPRPSPSAPTPKSPVPRTRPAPRDILFPYLRKLNLTELQLQTQLYEGYIQPKDIPLEVRRVLIQMSWLTPQGEVPDHLRRAPPQPQKPRKSRAAPTSTPMRPETDPVSTTIPFKPKQPFRMVLIWIGSLAGIVWCSLFLAQNQPFDKAPGEYIFGGLLGWFSGYLMGSLLWWGLPLLLPALGAYAAYFFGERAALGPEYLVALPVLAVLLSYGLVKAVGRL